MERRGFLKTLFGGAALAVLPPILVERLAATPIPASPEPPSLKLSAPPIQPPSAGTVLCLYRDMKEGVGQVLVASSVEFAVNIHTPVRPVPKVKWTKYGWIEDFDAPPDYIRGLMSWDADVYRMQWYEDPRRCFDEQLHMIALQEGHTWQGDVYITNYSISIPLEEEVSGEAKLMGTGELRFIIDKG